MFDLSTYQTVLISRLGATPQAIANELRPRLRVIFMVHRLQDWHGWFRPDPGRATPPALTAKTKDERQNAGRQSDRRRGKAPPGRPRTPEEDNAMVPGMVERDFRAAEVGRHEEIATARRALAGGEPSRASIAMVL